ncbi:MAG: BON domain-containing protein, partial [Gemmatimonadota bacterium]|nr:BON domain-containing protein [Gemmatimonadota bacterium]
RSWGYEEPSGRGEWEGGPSGGRYDTDDSYFRGGYTGAGYGYREPGYGGPYYGREPAYGGGYTSYYGRERGYGAGGYAGDYIREGGPGAFGGGGYYGGGYYGREPYYGGYGGTYGAGTYGSAGTYGRYGGGTSRETFFGRGPRGYRRSDERIREDINDRLTWHPDIDASDVEVRVENGEVTLSGVVEDRRAKRLAADIADEVAGVEDVHNQLKVRHGFLAGVTGEKADEREVSRPAEREGTEASARRATKPGATGRATSETSRRGA